jgi:F-type H+-transporting ATPase subunit alpha
MIIWAGTKGYLDDVPVEICRKFEAELYRFTENAHRAVLDEIASKKMLDADLTAKVKGIIEEFKTRFMAENAPAKAHA